jgi:hypothetical protein
VIDHDHLEIVCEEAAQRIEAGGQLCVRPVVDDEDRNEERLVRRRLLTVYTLTLDSP